MEQKKYKVLIVDDDKFLLDMYLLKFQKAGLEVSATPKAEDALKMLREGFKPDIILLDLIMPGMDGLQFLEIVRKEKLVENTSVVILTNMGQLADIDRAKSIGYDGYIIKAATIPSEVLSKVLSIHEKKVKAEK